MRVIIVAEIRLYRVGLAHVLDRSPRIDVIDSFAGVEDAMKGIADCCPDVVLLDMTTPDSLEAVRLFAEEYPEIKVLALGVPDAEDGLIACAEAGVAGYLFREAGVDDLVAAVESAGRGELTCSPRIAALLLQRVSTLASEHEATADHPALTKREQEVLELLEEGLTNKRIAARLFIETATVKNHVHNIIEKLGVRTRGEAAAKMRRSRRRRPRARAAAPSPSR